ncbi:MAG TPA: cell division ATP-binding protein FtsE [Chloroflexota bacterium]|jgi:cell division transport system ATP-binding protein|nr:cell division ATP-binding protein FtsE [Chloroflexota bacterium]
MPTSDPLVRFERVGKRYAHAVEALLDISFSVDSGDFAFVVGPSGSGKSTLLRLLLRDEQPTSGRVYVTGANLARVQRGAVPAFRRRMGVVFQDFKLLPALTVQENVAFALRVHGIHRRSVVQERVAAVLDLVGIADKAGRLPDTLSGGEQQRVSIARALVTGPELLLADEPTGNLDPLTALGIMELFTRINAYGMTVLVATHNREVVDLYQRRVLQLNAGRLVRDQRSAGYDLATNVGKAPPLTVSAPLPALAAAGIG